MEGVAAAGKALGGGRGADGEAAERAPRVLPAATLRPGRGVGEEACQVVPHHLLLVQRHQSGVVLVPQLPALQRANLLVAEPGPRELAPGTGLGPRPGPRQRHEGVVRVPVPLEAPLAQGVAAVQAAVEGAAHRPGAAGETGDALVAARGLAAAHLPGDARGGPLAPGLAAEGAGDLLADALLVLRPDAHAAGVDALAARHAAPHQNVRLPHVLLADGAHLVRVQRVPGHAVGAAVSVVARRGPRAPLAGAAAPAGGLLASFTSLVVRKCGRNLGIGPAELPREGVVRREAEDAEEDEEEVIAQLRPGLGAGAAVRIAQLGAEFALGAALAQDKGKWAAPLHDVHAHLTVGHGAGPRRDGIWGAKSVRVGPAHGPGGQREKWQRHRAARPLV